MRNSGFQLRSPGGCGRFGFTLMELILVMLILTFAVALIAPSLGHFTLGRTTSNLANAMVMEAEYARTQSINEGRVYRLNFDPAGRNFWLTVVNGATSDPINSDEGKKVDLPQQITMRTDVQPQNTGKISELYVQFQPNGRCDTAHVWFSDTEGKQIEVACDSPTEMYRVLLPQEMTR